MKPLLLLLLPSVLLFATVLYALFPILSRLPAVLKHCRRRSRNLPRKAFDLPPKASSTALSSQATVIAVVGVACMISIGAGWAVLAYNPNPLHKRRADFLLVDRILLALAVIPVPSILVLLAVFTLARSWHSQSTPANPARGVTHRTLLLIIPLSAALLGLSTALAAVHIISLVATGALLAVLGPLLSGLCFLNTKGNYPTLLHTKPTSSINISSCEITPPPLAALRPPDPRARHPRPRTSTDSWLSSPSQSLASVPEWDFAATSEQLPFSPSAEILSEWEAVDVPDRSERWGGTPLVGMMTMVSLVCYALQVPLLVLGFHPSTKGVFIVSLVLPPPVLALSTWQMHANTEEPVNPTSTFTNKHTVPVPVHAQLPKPAPALLSPDLNGSGSIAEPEEDPLTASIQIATRGWRPQYTPGDTISTGQRRVNSFCIESPHGSGANGVFASQINFSTSTVDFTQAQGSTPRRHSVHNEVSVSVDLELESDTFDLGLPVYSPKYIASSAQPLSQDTVTSIAHDAELSRLKDGTPTETPTSEPTASPKPTHPTPPLPTKPLPSLTRLPVPHQASNLSSVVTITPKNGRRVLSPRCLNTPSTNIASGKAPYSQSGVFAHGSPLGGVGGGDRASDSDSVRVAELKRMGLPVPPSLESVELKGVRVGRTRRMGRRL